jgi:hypothetical protein
VKKRDGFNIPPATVTGFYQRGSRAFGFCLMACENFCQSPGVSRLAQAHTVAKRKIRNKSSAMGIKHWRQLFTEVRQWCGIDPIEPV